MQRVRPLPGIIFRAETPVTVTLPRMDIAGFVGFAARGPTNTPVVVEDYPRFEDIFGSVYSLAWDEETATQQTACLAPAVKAFFAQGGRRCQIVRVAGKQAATNQFPIAGLLRTDAGNYQTVVANARSAGSWSDDLQVSAGLLLDALTFEAGAAQPGAIFTLNVNRQPIVPGDLLQIDCSDGLHCAYVAPELRDLVVRDDLLHVIARPERTFWFRRVNVGFSGTVRTLLPDASALAPGTLHVESGGVAALATTLDAAAGDWLMMETAARRAWLLVADRRGSELVIAAAWLQGHNPTAPVLTMARVRRVQISLQTRHEDDYYSTLHNLACAAPHPRFIGDLPDDDALFAPHTIPTQTDTPALWDAVRHPRFPLSMGFDQTAVIIPLGLETAPAWRGALPATQEPLVRDGLVPDVADYYALTDADWAAFMVDLHLDDALRFTGQYALMAEASDLLYLQGRTLCGLHALLPVEEISMIALTDVAQRGWLLTQRHTQPPPQETKTEPPDPCAVESPFEPCPPEFEQEPEAGKTYEILPGIPERAVWQLLPPVTYDASGLLEVQSAAAKMAAARGDMLAVLGMPKHYRTIHALRFQRQFAAALGLAGETTDSYAALYYPWVITREDSGDLLHTHPAGAACGTMAARSLARGAWIAPANEIVQGALGVFPVPHAGEEAALYNAGINLIRQMPRGYTLWGAYTQSIDFELENINVRRLLILLRRLALREGQSYVFAPHSPAFRGRVKQQFEQVLSRLFEQGAFAGDGPAQAYRVVIDETLNTQASIEQGRLIVELRVAPSQPLTFITVRLVQAESGLLAVQEVTTSGG